MNQVSKKNLTISNAKICLNQGKRLSYKVLSKKLSSDNIEKILSYIQNSKKKINSYQKKIEMGTSITQGLEKGSPVLSMLGKTARVINNRYEISGLDSLETVAHLSDYSKKRQLTHRGKQMNELLNKLDAKLNKLAKFFQHINDIKQQDIRKQEWADINCPMNFIEVDDDWVGEIELDDVELELGQEQEKWDSKISQQWEEINKKDYQPELTIKTTIGTFDKEETLRENLADALIDSEWKPIIDVSLEEEWTDWGELARQSSSNHSDSTFLKYAKKGQKVFQAVDEKVNYFTEEINAIKELIREVENQLGYSLYKKGLSKLHLDDEKLINRLENLVKQIDKVNDKVNLANSYVKKGRSFVNKFANKLERQAEYQELNNNPYAFRDKEETLVFEEEIVEAKQVCQVQEQNKSWFSKLWKK
ncbi:hypothetical protein [endosymbiont GvMRE of Glomus versiforme]|uniref:hypothetical protein n=1 Tax=endosymbiont GvMRE of Glomus versiforme TaxID=2039283 RepID=UPI000EE31506|nr:hypothetical protein [endosymbiont GvMRE of Glomus versiforme]RHZ36147.1 hypothetical protein GvMRE_Ic2g17 [endosymbiont GvMRE of Glomus versiforme]